MKQGNKGFTLLEVMVAAAVLAMGTVLIFQSFFSVLRAYEYCSGYVASSPFAQEKLWLASESIRAGGILPAQTGGETVIDGRKFKWDISGELARDRVYKVAVRIRWRAGKREPEVTRTAYALYEKQE